MANELNHIIVHCRDRRASARFLSDLLGAGAPMPIAMPIDWGPFTQVTSSNRVGIDFLDSMIPAEAINRSHIAFLVTDAEFDAIFRRIQERSIRYWADPMCTAEGTINHNYGGRGVYVLDPGQTVAIEFITRPYGDTPE